MAGDHIVVLDIGKTLSKLTLWTADGAFVTRAVRTNRVLDAGDYAALDADGIEAWMADTLGEFARRARIGAIIPVAHGAAAAVIRAGRLAAPPMDYEATIAAADSVGYDRPPFAETGSPALPDGLNLGRQLHRLERLRPGLLDSGATILTWPQYWAWRLSRVAATEVTSLGCHTDLWNPVRAGPSRLAAARGWAARFAPLRRAGETLGRVTPEWVHRAGLPVAARVLCGLHDSNAALLAARGFAEIGDREATVLSTGTWFVAMRSAADRGDAELAVLPEGRDCLLNVDAAGRPIPSARFMGGREIERLLGPDRPRIDEPAAQPALVAAAATVLAGGARAVPSFVPGVGPFPRSDGRWVDRPDDAGERAAAAAIYAALVADAALDLIGTRARILVEGRFAAAEVFVRTLAALRPGDAVYRAGVETDVSFGALRLIDPALRPAAALARVAPLPGPVDAYRAVWRRDLGTMAVAA